MNEFDTLDRVEVICARWILGDRGSSELEALLTTHLAGLPPAVVTQLKRLGAIRN
jgi:hypothetical protein